MVVVPNNATGNVTVKVGDKVGQWYGYKTYHRLYGSAEEAIALQGRKDNGAIATYRDVYNNIEGAGDIYFMDLDGDGRITTKDQTFIGSQTPKLYGGMGLQLYIGNSFNIGATFTYSLGNKRYWAMPADDVIIAITGILEIPLLVIASS